MVPLFPSQLSPAELFAKVREKGYDFSIAVGVVEQEIVSQLNALGPDAYKKPGISPVFNQTYISGSGLKIVGFEREGGSFGEEGHRCWKYSYGREASGQVRLRDDKTGREVSVYQTLKEEFPDVVPVDFDPMGLHGHSDDPIRPGFAMSQWDATIPGHDAVLCRTVHYTCSHHVRDYEERLPIQPTISFYPVNLGSSKAGMRPFDDDWLEEHLGQGHPFRIPR